MLIIRQDYTEEELDREFAKLEEIWEIQRFELEERKNRERIIKSSKAINDNTCNNTDIKVA